MPWSEYQFTNPVFLVMLILLVDVPCVSLMVKVVAPGDPHSLKLKVVPTPDVTVTVAGRGCVCVVSPGRMSTAMALFLYKI